MLWGSTLSYANLSFSICVGSDLLILPRAKARGFTAVMIKPLFKLGPTQSSSYHQLCGECNPHSQKNHNKAPYECSHSTCPQCADQDWPFLDDFYHVRRKTPGFSPGDIRREVFVYRYTNPPDGTIETLADGKFLLPMP